MEKPNVILRLNQVLENKINDLQKEIKSLMHSRDNDSKSSAGDKHETARAMVQIELENHQKQLNKFVQYKSEIGKIDEEENHVKIGFGSLIQTDQGHFFTSIGLGKIKVQNESVFCLSLGSPIGKLLFQKSTGDTLEFQSKKMKILQVS